MATPRLASAGFAILGPRGLFTEHRHASLVGLTTAAGFVVAVLAGRWFSRIVGWRRAAAAVAGLAAGGMHDLARFVWAPVRYRRRVRFLTRALLDPALPEVCTAALGTVRGALADQPGRWPYLLLVGPRVIVGIAGREPVQSVSAVDKPAASGAAGWPPSVPGDGQVPEARTAGRWAATGVRDGRTAQYNSTGFPVSPVAAPRPWQVIGPGRWTASQEAILAAYPPGRQPDRPSVSERGRPDPDACLVTIGITACDTGDTLVMLDLARLPAVGVVEGPAERCYQLAAAIATQLAMRLPPVGPRIRLMVTDDVLPDYGGPTLDGALDDLASRTPVAGPPASAEPSDSDGPTATDAPGKRAARQRRTVLVCVHPTEEQAARLAALIRRDAQLRAVVVGDWAGTRWRMTVDRLARVAMPELGIEADAEPVERALARVLRKGPARTGHPVRAAATGRAVAPRPMGPEASGPDRVVRAGSSTRLPAARPWVPDLTEFQLAPPVPAPPPMLGTLELAPSSHPIPSQSPGSLPPATPSLAESGAEADLAEPEPDEIRGRSPITAASAALPPKSEPRS